jgi:dipeptidyl aminopeptidase/acylaminoacyl peptidase
VNDAEERSWEIVRRAFEERAPAPRRRTRSSSALVFVALVAALTTAVIAAVFSPPGRAVFERVREAVGVEHADQALFSLNAPGRLLVVSAEGGGVWLAEADGYKRKLGTYDDAEWSPHGLYVIATRRNELAALDVDKGVRWTLARHDVAWPAWSGSRVDTRIAYLAASGLRVVGGDGQRDRLLDATAAAVPPVWEPSRTFAVTYVSGSGTVVLRDANGHVLWRRHVDVLPTALQWSSDGRLLAVRSSHRVVVLDRQGRVRRTISSLGSLLTADAFKPGTHSLAVVARAPARTELRLVDVDHPGRSRLLFAGPGVFGDIVWSPDASTLLVDWPTANQWLFLRGQKVHAVAIGAEFPRHDDVRPTLLVAGRWCCR